MDNATALARDDGCPVVVPGTKRRGETTAIEFIKAIFQTTTDHKVYTCSFTNDRSANTERHVISRNPADIEQFIERWDVEGRGTFFCISTIKDGENKRNKDNVSEIALLHADIDFKGVEGLPSDPQQALDEVSRQISRLMHWPSIIVFSGHGLHCYWLFKEALDAQAERDRAEAAMRQLADVVAGDLAVCEISRVMRMPGSHNTKNGDRIPVEVIEFNPDRRYELDDLEEWLSEQSPVMLRKERESAGTAGADPDDFFAQYAKTHGVKAPIDVQKRLENMMFMGGGDSSIHETQIQCGASMLNAGMDKEDVVAILMAYTKRAAGEYGARWNWRREERNIRRDCEGWIKKHPQDERKKAEPALRIVATGNPSSGDDMPTVQPGAGHNSDGKMPLRLVIANAYIAAMSKGIVQRFQRVPDLKGNEHVWRCRAGLWGVLKDADAARSLHPALQKILNDLGRENKSANSLFNEAAAHVLRNAEVCKQAAVSFDAHGKVPALNGLIDPTTRVMEPIRFDHYATWQLPVGFDANAACPHWEQALNDAFADMTDADRKTTCGLVQELVGMALIDNKPKALSRALVLYGGPDTGKTVVLKVITALFGGAITTPFAKLEGNHGLQSFVHRLPWVLGEAFNQAGWHVSDMVKCIITGDPVEINGKNIPAISMKANTPAFWATNHPPKFKESSGSMATRMVIIPMTRTFDKESPVGVAAAARKSNSAWEPFDLIINTELSGVLNWALIGLKRALERGHFVNTKAGNDLLEQSRKDSNVAASFLEECVTYDLTVMIDTADLYAAFKEWWIADHGEKAVVPSPTHFGLELAALPKSRIAQNKDKYKLAGGQRFYLGCYLNEAGEVFWKDGAASARLLKPQSRLAEKSKSVKEPVPERWKDTEDYRRIVANADRVKKEQAKGSNKIGCEDNGSVVLPKPEKQVALEVSAEIARPVLKKVIAPAPVDCDCDCPDIPDFLQRY